MTGPGEPTGPAPPVQPPRGPQGASSGVRRGRAEDDDDPVLAPREEARIAQAVTVVGRRGRGPVAVAALVAAAFLLGLIRPWDMFVPASTSGTAVAPLPGTTRPFDGVDGPTSSDAERTRPPAPQRALTCANPLQWRTATIEDWTGRQARVWRAAPVVTATGPDDPSIPFEPIVAASVTAIGWCAPVDGPERPPLALEARLYRIRDGVASPLPYDRLEPREQDALGELWIPRARGVGNRPTWQLGRYVIELRSPSGSYVRYLGLELTDRLVRESPSVPAPGRSASAPPSP